MTFASMCVGTLVMTAGIQPDPSYRRESLASEWTWSASTHRSTARNKVGHSQTSMISARLTQQSAARQAVKGRLHLSIEPLSHPYISDSARPRMRDPFNQQRISPEQSTVTQTGIALGKGV